MSIRRTVISLVAVVALGLGAFMAARVVGQDHSVHGTVRPPATTTQQGQDTLRGEVTLDTRRQQLIGVRTVKAEHAQMAPEIRISGTVTYDETRQAEISTRVDGWIKELYADYTGRPIRKGEALFTLYSPDILATENEYLLALRGRTHDSAAGTTHDYAERLVSAARDRLLRLDMTAEEIEQLEARGTSADTITFRSPVSGVAVEKAAVKGMRVMAGQALYRVADLSSVWVEAEIYESDLGSVRVGSPATVTVQAYPDRPYTGRVSYIYPSVTQETRTVRARISLANPGGLLKPNMLATVTLAVKAPHALVLPPDAIVDTGTEHIVFVAEGAGRFTPRRIDVGRRTPEQVEVLSGLDHGDEVAASATFFLDSESQLRGALQGYEATPAEAAGSQNRTHAAESAEVTFRTDPDMPKVGEATAIVTVTDAKGQAVRDAEVNVTLFMAAMPSMNMPAMKTEAKLLAASGAEYRGTVEIMTAGRWDVTVTVTKAGQKMATRQLALVVR